MESDHERLIREKKDQTNLIKEELIAAAMHPNRVKHAMDQCDNIEEYFENC